MRTAGLITKVAPLLLLSVLSCGSPAHAQMPAPQGTPTRRAGITGSQCVAGGLQATPKPGGITLDQAIELGRQELRRRGYENMTVEADCDNTFWKKHMSYGMRSGSVESRIRKMDATSYWAIWYGRGRNWVGGDAWVFIGRVNGEIIGVIQYK